MIHTRILLSIVCFFLFYIQTATCQTVAEDPGANKFEAEIVQFEQADQQQFPPKKAILFTGSSSIRLWTDLQERFADRKVINRGFGGSGIPDLIHYVDRIVVPYQPKQVVIYSGENDIADGKPAQEVYADLVKLVAAIRKKLPAARITYISIKPSPSRITVQEEMKKANTLIKNYLARIKRADYVNIYDSMLDAEGKPNETLFVTDRLHMNQAGYDIWAEAIKNYLVK